MSADDDDDHVEVIRLRVPTALQVVRVLDTCIAMACFVVAIFLFMWAQVGSEYGDVTGALLLYLGYGVVGLWIAMTLWRGTRLMCWAQVVWSGLPVLAGLWTWGHAQDPVAWPTVHFMLTVFLAMQVAVLVLRFTPATRAFLRAARRA